MEKATTERRALGFFGCAVLLLAVFFWNSGAVRADAAYRAGTQETMRLVTQLSDGAGSAAAPEKTVILSIGSSQIIVDDGLVQCDVAPEIRQNRTFVPLRAVSEIFDAQCGYDAGQRLVTISRDGQEIAMTVGAEHYSLNGEEKPLDAPAYIAQDRTMVPVRFIAEAFGSVVKVTYDDAGAVADVMFQL